MTSQLPVTPKTGTINKPKSASEPVLDVAIIGAGFGGLCMAIKLHEAGYRNIAILEKGAEVGGTWRDNTYPGAACDVQSHLYSYSFEGNPDWSKRYASWQEIQNYILHCTDKYQLRSLIHFHQEITAAYFDEQQAQWHILTADGNHYYARHVVMASGPLHVPAIPDIPGLSSFKGKVFHSAQWDHGYDLKGKRVASIGTGGSAIQYLPEIAPDVAQLDVYQRSPAWVIPRDERAYPAFEKRLFRRFPALRKLHRARLYWSNESRLWPILNPSLAKGLQNMAKLFIRWQVKDKALARKLTPDYTIGCKRVLISNKYFPIFNRANVSLVTEGIAEVRNNSIVTRDGKERPVDCIILGTGFVTDPRIYMKDFPITGLGGRDLRDDWRDGAEAYLGTTVTGYPNLYQLVGPNTGLGHNSIIFMIEAQVHYVLQSLAMLSKKNADYVHVKPTAQRQFNEDLQSHIKNTVWSSGCQSWYQQADGKNVAIWPYSTWRFWLQTRQVKEQDYQWVSLSGQGSRVERARELTAR